jgi:hypothetical protein
MRSVASVCRADELAIASSGGCAFVWPSQVVLDGLLSCQVPLLGCMGVCYCWWWWRQVGRKKPTDWTWCW